MISKEIAIINNKRITAKPASLFVKLTEGYKSNIQIEKEGMIANAKSLISILSMGIYAGAKITVKTDGEDEQAAMDAVADFLINLQ